MTQLDRRSLYTALNIPNQIPPDGALALGQPVRIDPTTARRGATVLTFAGRKGEQLLGLATRDAAPKGSDTSLDAAIVRVFGPDGSEIGTASGMLGGQALTLPADGSYLFVIEGVDPSLGSSTVTIWDAADAPAAARQPSANGTCTSTYFILGSSQSCTSVSSGPVTGTTFTAGPGETVKESGRNGGGTYSIGTAQQSSSATSVPVAPGG